MKKRKITRWIVLALFVAAIAWTAVSANPWAQGVRQLLGRKPDQPVLANSFQVSAHSFRYYKFTLPQGSKNMALAGEFHISLASGNAVNATGIQAQENTPGLEVYVLNEPAFESWLRGNNAASIYQSGRVSEQKVKQVLAPGAGVYYLVFSNKFDPASAKKVTASLALHSTSWFSY